MLSIRSGAHKFFRRFFDFSQFKRNFAKIVAPSSNKNENYLAHLKGKSLLKKSWKRHQNRPINSDTKPAQNILPRTNSAPASERDKNPYKHHIFVPTAGSRRTIFPKLCTVTEHAEKKVPTIFRSNAYFFSYKVHGKFGLDDRRAVSQQ